MAPRPRQPQTAAVHVEDDDAARQAQEAEVLAMAAPVALDPDDGDAGPDPDSTLASGVPQRAEVVVVDEVTDYTPVIVDEVTSEAEYVEVRINQDVDPFFYGPDMQMSFERGKRYRVHREIANMLRRKEMVV